MRIDERKKVRNVFGENIVIMQSDNTVDMTKVVALNESALLVHDRLVGKDFTVADVARVLTDEYDVDEATALRDAEALVASMRKEHLIVD
ncbi:MAG: PqqD family protein [Bacteroidales bacterium]|nr:PqqD family protein [Bacteroidales bacterium]